MHEITKKNLKNPRPELFLVGKPIVFKPNIIKPKTIKHNV
jgi:hypothetical protein